MEAAETFNLACDANATALPEVVSVLSMDVERAKYCSNDLAVAGHDDLLVCAQGDCGTSLIDRRGESGNVTGLSVAQWCSAVGAYYDLNCTNETWASVSLTCPMPYDSAVCQYFVPGSRGKLGYWSTEGCVLASYDAETGIASCNCSHLTDFAAEEREEFTESSTTFAETLATVSTITEEDVEENQALLYLLGAIWFLSMSLFARDTINANMHRTAYLCAFYQSEEFQTLFAVRPTTAPARALLKARAGFETLESPVAKDSGGAPPMLGRGSGGKAGLSMKGMFESMRSMQKGNPARKKGREALALSLRSIHDKGVNSSNLHTAVSDTKDVVAQYVTDDPWLGSRGCCGAIARVKLALCRWANALWEENELISCFNCGAWFDTNALPQRGIAFLAKVITLLLLCCLAAPDFYLCPDLADGPNDDGGIANAVGVPPMVEVDEVNAEKEAQAYLDGHMDDLTELFFVTLWTLPVVMLLTVVYDFGQKIAESDRQLEER